jgi:nucleoside-diphosphate-sugar epimerase
MVHVDDVVRAAVAAAAEPAVAGGRFIVSDGRHYDTRDLYEVVCRALGQPARRGWPQPLFRLLAVAGDALERVSPRRMPFDGDAYRKLFGSAAYDGTALWQRLGMEPMWTLERAIDAIVAHERGQ